MSALQGAVESTAPVSRLHAQRSSFPVPTGREEEWRFTPLRRLRGLHGSAAVPAAKVAVEVDAAPEASSPRTLITVGRDAIASAGTLTTVASWNKP